MEMNSFGEDLIVKTRKPYTITKQREKWTDEEHNRFLEALKLYGRAWQRIEEHIGTKTAIQIRSHAQKFFTKLEKEAGTPLGQAHDIDIPPPRPKKKPNYPYPRKTGLCSISPTTEAAADKKTSKTMNPLPQQINKQEASIAAKSLQETKECSDEANCSVVLNLFKDAPSASIPSRDKRSKNQVSFREYVPMTKQPKEPPSLKESSLTIEVNLESTSKGTDQALGRTSGINRELHELSAGCSKGEKQLESDHEAKGMQTTFIQGSNLKATVEDEGYSPSSELINHTIPATSFISHPFPTFPPFAQLSTTQDLYRSFLSISSDFCSQIVSTLQQNPAAHAAACMAAASLGSTSEEVDSSTMAAIAAVTVSAASAWWAANRLIPFFPPIHASGFAYSPPVCSFPVANTTQLPKEKMEERHEKQAILSSSSSSKLEKIEKKISSFNPLSDAAYHNVADKAKVRKHERSSCGSNTTSSSEIETDGVPKKNGEETNDEDKQSSHLQNLPAGEFNFRRARTTLCFNETWKEVSEEGRVAFQALFSRDILPQSFAIQLDSKAEMGIMAKEEEEILRLSRREEGSSTQNSSIPNGNGNLKVRRTGFKPYKRCSAEVEVLHRVSGNDETSNKKIRLQGEVSS